MPSFCHYSYHHRVCSHVGSENQCAEGPHTCARPFNRGTQSTNPCILELSYGCQQPSALCKNTKPSFWRLGMCRNTSFHQPWRVFVPRSLSLCNQRFGLLTCTCPGLLARLIRAIASKRHSVLFNHLRRNVSVHVCFESRP